MNELLSEVLSMAENQLARRTTDVVMWQTELAFTNLSVVHKKTSRPFRSAPRFWVSHSNLLNTNPTACRQSGAKEATAVGGVT